MTFEEWWYTWNAGPSIMNADAVRSYMTKMEEAKSVWQSATEAERARVIKAFPNTSESEEYCENRVEYYKNWSCETHKLIRMAALDMSDWLRERINLVCGEKGGE